MLEIQSKVNNAYYEKFKQYTGGFNLSVPHIPRISERYFTDRVVVIGQETNTWYRKGNDDLKDVFLKNIDISKVCLEKRYDHFIANEAAKYKGMFWKFNKLLYEKDVLHGNLIENNSLSHVWLNLFVVESCKDKNDKNGRPTNNLDLRNKIISLQQELIYDVLSILKPRIIIALIGHQFDNIFLRTALNTNNVCLESIDKQNILNKWQLGRIIIKDKVHNLYPCKIIRSYHPSYFLGYINRNSKIVDKINCIGLRTTPSSYYLHEFLTELQRIKIESELL